MEAQVRTCLNTVQKYEFPEQGLEEFDVDAFKRAEEVEFPQPLKLGLRDALALAARHSRTYQAQKENLYSSAISLWVVAHQFEWGLSTKSLQASLERDLGIPQTTAGGGLNLKVERTFMTGARLGLGLSVNVLRYLTGDPHTDIWSTASATLTQPLLRRRGQLVTREPLTSAERRLVYDLRSYVRDRKDLILKVSNSYYDVLSAMDSLEVSRRSYDNFRAAREREEWRGRAGRAKQVYVDQARQRELNARVSLLSAEQNLREGLDSLKQLLGLPLGVTVELSRDDLDALTRADLPTPPMTLDETLAYGLEKRLDFATTKDRLADAERRAKIAEDALRAKLDLRLSANASSPREGSLEAIKLSRGRYEAALDAELPFDQRPQLRDYREALIDLRAAQRAVDLKRDEITSRIRTDWRNLETGKESYGIQQMGVELAQKRVENAEMELEAGRVQMRDLLDARDDLTDAENALTRALVSHRKNWLRLLVDMEMLPAEPDSLWSSALEVGPAAPPQAPNQNEGAERP